MTDDRATVLLKGKDAKDTQPIVLSRMAGKSHLLSTILEYPTDFPGDFFNAPLINAIHRALN